MSAALVLAESLGGGFTVEQLPTVNAVLNATATVLLVLGYRFIRQRREAAHQWTMLAAFGVSIAFLACYLVYHYKAGHVPFVGPPAVRAVYLAILVSHVMLAALVPFLAVATIYLGLRDRRAAHRKLARWTFPIWLYVSITGVVVYWMLYHLYPTTREASKIGQTRPASTSRLAGATCFIFEPIVGAGVSIRL